MTYRKFKADYLFTGKELAGDDSVLITTTDGTVQDIVPAAAAGPDIAYYPGVLTPGFINCHCHLELSHMRGVLPEGTGLVDFLSAVIRRRGESMVDPATAMAAAEQEMLDNGIVAVGDICNTADTLPLKKKGALEYYNFIETMGFVEQGAPMRFAASKAVFDQFESAFPGRNSIVPHAPYSVSPALFKLIADHAAGQTSHGANQPSHAGGHLLSMHSQETEEENTFFLTGKGDFLRLYAALGVDVSFFKGTGKRSLESTLPHFHKDQALILVHDVATNSEDLRTASNANLYFCLCPNANRYIGRKLPDVALLMGSGYRLSIGTDSLASNWQLSVLAELKTLQTAFPDLTTATLLQWATSNGAEALRLQDRLGTFDRGKRPGVVCISKLNGDRLTADSQAQQIV
jgi:cytosine/adenosine deaminase-related metal-dependent hydrolase